MDAMAQIYFYCWVKVSARRFLALSLIHKRLLEEIVGRCLEIRHLLTTSDAREHCQPAIRTCFRTIFFMRAKD